MGKRIFVIGASCGGIQYLCRLLSRLPNDFPAPIFITQHLGRQSEGWLPTILQRSATLEVRHPVNGEPIESGVVYVAPPDRHMSILDAHVYLSHGPRENLFRPAIDPLFRSAAAAHGPAVVGIILTGHLDDGTAGLLAIKRRGGTAIVQEPEESDAPSMPASALRYVRVDHRCSVLDMPELFKNLAKQDPPALDSGNVDRLMQIEVQIAAGEFEPEAWRALEQLSVACGFSCPCCPSPLFELPDRQIRRFRCGSGHAFSARSLLVAQSEAREAQLSTVSGALRVQASQVL
jgi:two-component system chemotaxis response regulator CheB